MTSKNTSNRITKVFSIKYPIIQAGMVYCSGGKLAAAAANAGCLGLIGAGSMSIDILRQQIKKAQDLTKCPIGINIPLLYPAAEEQIDLAIEMGIRIFFTSAGNPKRYTAKLKAQGATVAHVVSSPELAIKSVDAGVDVVVAEGFEAGGHNGRDEITTMVLVPQVRDAVDVPLIAAGGIADGRQIKAALCLGADGVQIGSRFAATVESSAHNKFKQKIISADFGDTKLMLKKVIPVRLLNNKFAQEIATLESKGVSSQDLEQHLGKGRARKGMLEGDMDDGELEIGQVSAMINDIPTCKELVSSLVKDADL